MHRVAYLSIDWTAHKELWVIPCIVCAWYLARIRRRRGGGGTLFAHRQLIIFLRLLFSSDSWPWAQGGVLYVDACQKETEDMQNSGD